MPKNFERFQADPTKGLTLQQVEKRIANHLVHYNTEVPTKSIGQIIWSNFFTLFNLLNFGLGLAVLLVGSYKNLLFLGIVICNLLISILQEIKAKKTIDKLSLFSESKVEVIRDSKKQIISANEIVLDDIINYYLGNQVLVDSTIITGECLVNESFITGEDVPIKKIKGDLLLSGSFVISGHATTRCEHIGEDNYTSKISKDAKYLKKLNSELMLSLQKIIKWLSFIVIPVGIFLFWSQLRIPDTTLQSAVIHTVAGLIGMIPDGLVLLTSTVLAVSVIRLGKYKVLVQELYCIEMLARVDVLCLDKTGTLTEGKMELKDLIVVPGQTKEALTIVLKNMCGALEDYTPTMMAIRDVYPNSCDWKVIKTTSFSSDTKYSSVTFDDIEYLLGAPEFILPSKKFCVDCSLYEKDYRVLLLASRKDGITKELGYLLIQDKIRHNAKDTLKYFKQQGVDIRIISGDNPLTVSQIAKRVGVEQYDKYIDLTTVKTAEELQKAAQTYTIFGRVTPEQKKQLIISIKKQGHTVAMTGDGVNDVLALKESDCSIAMASGSQAAKSVSQLVLLDSNFDSMPKIVEEGRRTINNIQRSASLFLVKTIYTSLLAIMFLCITAPYLFEPIQMSLTNMVTIGIPSFMLALEPNKERVSGGFLKNVISKALPTALTIFSMLVIIMITGAIFNLNQNEVSTLSVLIVAACGFLHLYRISHPFTFIRKILFVSMIIVFLLEIFFLPELFSLAPYSIRLTLLFISGVILSIGISYGYHKISKIIEKRYYKRIS